MSTVFLVACRSGSHLQKLCCVASLYFGEGLAGFFIIVKPQIKSAKCLQLVARAIDIVGKLTVRRLLCFCTDS